jgi:hypothetical protein
MRHKAHLILLAILTLAWALAMPPSPVLGQTGQQTSRTDAPGDEQVHSQPLRADPVLATVIDRSDYRQRLRAMWLGEVIANWTGRRTEGCCCPGCPGGGDFLTDDDWGGQTPGGNTIDFVLDQDPWTADDDTDIEYVYQYLLEQHGLWLSPEEIAAGWIAHINRFIWISNARARALMDENVLPPATGMACANRHSHMIDAQLTTEMFGAYCPGRPDLALEISHLPIRTTAEGHAAHAAQVFVVMYALAVVVPDDLTPAERSVWLIEQARGALPETSKAVDIIDFVLGWYLSHPQGRWEDCRDAIYVRYQLEDDLNGYNYRGWAESSSNFAATLMALLYGEGDYKRTIQIATLAGWDSDNPASTLGGLLGLMLGYDELVAQFPGVTLSDRFDIYATRDNLPDHLPDDPAAQDTFASIAERQLSVVDEAVAAAGGHIDTLNDRWIIPRRPSGSLWRDNPLRMIDEGSANNQLSRVGGSVSASSSVDSDPPEPSTVYGNRFPGAFANLYEQNFSGATFPTLIKFYSTQNGGSAPGDWVTLTVTYDRAVEIRGVRFIEGNHFDEPIARGGYFTECFLEVQVDGQWLEPVDVAQSEALDASRPFQTIDFLLAEPLLVTGVRLTGRVGGADAFVTVAELDALLANGPLE